MLKEFRPTILFLVKFLGIYLVGNLLYGAWITHWYPLPDPATQWITEQSAWVLNQLGQAAVAVDYPGKPTTALQLNNRGIVSVYEGCNGLNVAIVFLAFLFAFGPYRKALWWFVPMGLTIIHVANLGRIVLLFLVSLFEPNYLYFTHKYLFTAFIYLFVFLLWVWWVLRFSKSTSKSDALA